MSVTLSPIRKRWLNGAEACRYAGFSDETLRRRRIAGEITFHLSKDGKRKMYDRHELDALLEPVPIEEYLKTHSYDESL